MLDNDMIEFLTYRNAMKSNYRKGVHALRCILNNRKQAETFAGSLGGVSLVLGVSQPDGNSEALRALLEGSAVIDQATLTWLKNWWPEQCGSWDTLAADQGRCSTIATDPFLWERVGVSPVGAGKILAGLVGQDSRNFAAMQAVASSATAMQAVASSATAMQAVAASPVAIAAIYRSDVALSAVDSEVSAAATFYGADSVAMGKAVVILAGLDPAGYADMSAVAASATAMSAVAASATAMSAVAANYVALVALYSNAEALSTAQGTTVGAAALAGAGSVATGKAAAKLAGLDPDDFADMAAVAASSTAMAAVAASSTAMAAVAARSTAMAAVAASATARSAIAGSNAAREELKKSPLIVEKTGIIPSGSTYWNSTGITLTSIKGVLIATSAGNSDNALTILAIDDATLATDEQTRNAAPKNNSGYLSWIDSQPNYLWVRQKIRMAAYYTSTKVKYIPC